MRPPICIVLIQANEARQHSAAPVFGLFLMLCTAVIHSDSTVAASASIDTRRTWRTSSSGMTEMQPVFEQTASNVSGFEGQSVYLPCRVHNLGDKVVSWMRSRDLHILTSGNLSFSSDPRFKAQHLEGSDAWTLRLDRLKKSDAGGYECQVNTEPKIMYAVQLAVRDLSQASRLDGQDDEPHSQQTRISYESTAPVAAIMGPREVRVQGGATVSIKCLVSSPYQTRPIKGVQWLRDNKLLTFQAAATGRGGINVETVTGMAQTLTEATISNVSAADSGEYSCRPSDGKLDSINLYVQEQYDEAMLRDDQDQTASAHSTAISAASLSSLLTLLRLLTYLICSVATYSIVV